MYLRVVKRREDGIVVRGAKVMICGTAAANEIFVMPTTRLRREDADYAVSFAIPKDAPGITIVEARHASDDRDLEDGFDNPVTRGGITQAYIFFENVFVPTRARVHVRRVPATPARRCPASRSPTAPPSARASPGRAT